ncbi:MAG: sulfotransferase [Chloroflexi bacterium]|nr:sulfotransferase [Chloroflexota bacterium]
MEPTHTFITIVSGYPRSGTSLMMQMLEAGGLSVLRDEQFRPADERNPRGYYEIQAAMELGKEGQTTDWVADARGKAVKVIAYQLRHLPPEFSYRVVFMRRRIAEILASSGEFKLLREDSPLSEREKILAYKTEYVMYEAWLMKQKHLPALFVNYNDLIDNPTAPVARLRDFLGVPLDADKMLAAIDPALYRNRAQG